MHSTDKKGGVVNVLSDEIRAKHLRFLFWYETDLWKTDALPGACGAEKWISVTRSNERVHTLAKKMRAKHLFHAQALAGSSHNGVAILVLPKCQALKHTVTGTKEVIRWYHTRKLAQLDV